MYSRPDRRRRHCGDEGRKYFYRFLQPPLSSEDENTTTATTRTSGIEVGQPVDYTLCTDDPAIDEDKLIKDAADERADIATMDRRVRQLTGSRTRIRKARDTPANVDGRH